MNRKKFQITVYTASMEKYFSFRLLGLTEYIYDKLYMFQIIFRNDEHFMHPWFLVKFGERLGLESRKIYEKILMFSELRFETSTATSL